jgi:hypothetical protein
MVLICFIFSLECKEACAIFFISKANFVAFSNNEKLLMKGY